jgi:hypothetical protein
MRTQKEVNHYLQENTVHVAAIYDIVKYLKDFNLKLPNNVILHEKGINQVDFFKWFENRSVKAGDVLVSEYGNIVLLSHIDKDDIVYYHCLMTPSRFSINLDCGVGKIYNCSLASESQKQRLFEKLHKSGYTYNVITNSLEKIVKKFDFSTLKPFDKVLVRNRDNHLWIADLFSYTSKSEQFVCIVHTTNQCIPYKNNEHLLGTSNDCDDFYKIWE